MGAVLAWAYVRFGATPNVDLVLSGFNAAVVGLIIAITFKMVATSIARIWQMGVAAAALLLSFAGNAPPAEVVVIGVALGLGADFAEQRRVLARRGARKPKPPVALPDDGTVLPRAAPQPDDPRAPPREPGKLRVPIAVALLAAAWLSPTLRDHVRAYVAFFRTGLGAYGGGFAIIPHLKQVMAQSGWLTDKQFADAVAIGQLTPGPVLLLGTFIGYVHEGTLGALLATLAIFAGPFGLIVIFGAWLDRVRSRRWVRASLRGLTPAVVGLMASAALTLGSGFGSNVEIGIAAATALTMSRFEINPVLFLVVGGVARVALRVAGVRA
jgi:chromate transporter